MLLTKIILARTYISTEEKITSSASSNTSSAPSLITRIINKVTDILEKVIDMLQHLWHMLPPINIDAGLLYQLPPKKTMTLEKFYQGFFA